MNKIIDLNKSKSLDETPLVFGDVFILDGEYVIYSYISKNTEIPYALISLSNGIRWVTIREKFHFVGELIEYIIKNEIISSSELEYVGAIEINIIRSEVVC